MAEALPAGKFLFASESVTEGHPDKLCDRVSDAIVDLCLAQDPEARISCEACTKSSMVMILGEVLTKASVEFEPAIREVVKAVGYDSEDKGLDYRTMNVIVAVEDQSPDLLQAVTSSSSRGSEEPNAGGVAFGYATSESKELMPWSHIFATKLCEKLDSVRKSGPLRWVLPRGGRAQVTVQYREAADGSVVAERIHSVLMSVQQTPDIKPDQVHADLMEQVVRPALPEALLDSNTVYLLTGSLAAASTDTGLSGRKLGADTYGGWAGAGAAAMSGRDGASFARAAAYGARWGARSLVAAGLCKRCFVQVSMIPGARQPVTVCVHSYGSAAAAGHTDAELASILLENFDFRPGSLQSELRLREPKFQRLSAYGHLGRTDLEVAWEKDKELRMPASS